MRVNEQKEERFPRQESYVHQEQALRRGDKYSALETKTPDVF
jgi:hypothetical protein